jgi:hypothetical protein
MMTGGYRCGSGRRGHAGCADQLRQAYLVDLRVQRLRQYLEHRGGYAEGAGVDQRRDHRAEFAPLTLRALGWYREGRCQYCVTDVVSGVDVKAGL